MFQIQLAAGDTSVSNDMFDLNEKQQQIVRKNMALPRVTTWIAQCIQENNFADGAKAAYKKLLDDYQVTQQEWQSTSVDFYYQDVKRVAASRAVPSAEDMARLSSLQQFLDCPADKVARVNLELLGDKYVKAVTEAMTPSGVITEEYKDGLERLRNRLGLGKGDAEQLLGLSARTRLGPVIKDLVDIWKSDVAGTARAGAGGAAAAAQEKQRNDKSRDPISSLDNVLGFMETGAQKDGGGPNVFMREVLNLVDFFEENYGEQWPQSTTSSSTSTTTSTSGSVEEDKLPITAVGIAPEEDLVGLYKHYLITRLSEADGSLRSRYEEKEAAFAALLGISKDGQQVFFLHTHTHTYLHTHVL